MVYVIKENVLIIKYLLKYGANPNLPNKLFQQTPVHFACKNNVDPTILLLLIQYNGSLVYKDNDGKNVEFRDDRKGHEFESGYKLPPHINDPKDRHFFYDGKGNIHNVEYKKKEGK